MINLVSAMAISFSMIFFFVLLFPSLFLFLLTGLVLIPIGLLAQSWSLRYAVHDPKATIQQLAIRGVRLRMLIHGVLVSSDEEEFRLKVAGGRGRVKAALGSLVTSRPPH